MICVYIFSGPTHSGDDWSMVFQSARRGAARRWSLRDLENIPAFVEHEVLIGPRDLRYSPESPPIASLHFHTCLALPQPAIPCIEFERAFVRELSQMENRPLRKLSTLRRISDPHPNTPQNRSSCESRVRSPRGRLRSTKEPMKPFAPPRRIFTRSRDGGGVLSLERGIHDHP